MPYRVTTDKLRSDGAALNELNCGVSHCTEQYANYIAELSHRKTRSQQMHMRQFKSVDRGNDFCQFTEW